MSTQEFDTDDTKRYTLTALLSFVIIFFILVMMSQCHGSYEGPHKQNVVTEFNN